ncbi:MAG: DoxX family protein [Comamonas sp.]
MPLYDALGKLLLRLTIGGLMLPHGLTKLLSGWPHLTGITGIKVLLAAKGLPTWLAYGVYATEIAAPVLLIVGLWTRSAALLLAFGMVMAVYLAHLGDIGTLSATGAWGIRNQALFLFGALAIALMGPGRYALRPS